VQIMLLGIGLRYQYKKLITVVLEKPTEEDIKELSNELLGISKLEERKN